MRQQAAPNRAELRRIAPNCAPRRTSRGTPRRARPSGRHTWRRSLGGERALLLGASLGGAVLDEQRERVRVVEVERLAWPVQHATTPHATRAAAAAAASSDADDALGALRVVVQPDRRARVRDAAVARLRALAPVTTTRRCGRRSVDAPIVDAPMPLMPPFAAVAADASEKLVPVRVASASSKWTASCSRCVASENDLCSSERPPSLRSRIDSSRSSASESALSSAETASASERSAVRTSFRTNLEVPRFSNAYLTAACFACSSGSDVAPRAASLAARRVAAQSPARCGRRSGRRASTAGACRGSRSLRSGPFELRGRRERCCERLPLQECCTFCLHTAAALSVNHQASRAHRRATPGRETPRRAAVNAAPRVYAATDGNSLHRAVLSARHAARRLELYLPPRAGHALVRRHARRRLRRHAARRRRQRDRRHRRRALGPRRREAPHGRWLQGHRLREVVVHRRHVCAQGVRRRPPRLVQVPDALLRPAAAGIGAVAPADRRLRRLSRGVRRQV